MAFSLINTFNIGDDAELRLDGASYVTTAAVGDVTYVFVASKFDSGVSVFSLGDDGTLTNVFNFADNNTINLRGAFAVTTATVGDSHYLFVSSIEDYGVTVFSVGADGHLTNVANQPDDATLKLALTADVETAVVGGTTYLFASGVNDDGVSVFAVGADGKLTNVDNVADNDTSLIQGPQGMSTAVVDGTTYLFVTGFNNDGVGVYSVAADGHLTNVFNVRDNATLEIGGPVDDLAVTVGGTTYLVVSGFSDDGLSVFSVAANGALTNVFNLSDDGTLELDNPVGLSTAVINGTTYLFVVGADDDGLSVFTMGADGTLTNVANVTDDNTLKLDRPIGVATVVINGQIYAITASNFDSGVSVFKLADDTAVPNHAPTLVATGNDPTFTEGGAAADLFGAPQASTGDPGQTFTSLTLTVTHVVDGANEILSFLGHDLALTDGNSVAGATVSFVGTTATVAFTGTFDAAALQALIDDLAYRNTSENSTEADRVVTITRLTDSGGTANGGADTATLAIVSRLDVNPVNDPALITGDAAGVTAEAGGDHNNAPGTPTATGNLDSTDVDGQNDAWFVLTPGTTSISGYGTYQVAANGVWTYALDNTNTTVQALNDGGTLTDTFNAMTTDGTLQLVTITIHGQNDAAVISGDASGSVTKSGSVATDSGDLDGADVDNANDAWQAVATGAATANGFGTYALSANGVWTYTLDNANATVQALNDGGTLIDTFRVLTQDGTSQLVTVAIHGANNAAVITGSANGSVLEAGIAAGTPTASGNLDAADVDNTNDAWQAVAAGAATTNGFGTYALSANGVWTYTLDNANATVQALNNGGTLTDTFTALTEDGTSQLVTITIHGANDAAVISGSASGSVLEAGIVAGTPTATGNLDAADVDNIADAWQAVAAGGATANGFGTYALSANGVWTYTLDNANATAQALNNGGTLTDTFTVLTQDGTSQLVTVTIHGANDAATISGSSAGDITEAGVNNGTPTATGNLDAVDVDNAADAWQAVAAGGATANGFGTYALTANGQWTYTLDNANTTVQALNDGGALTDTFTVLTQDGSSQRVTVTIHGTNDAATITGDASGVVTRSGTVSDSGNLDAADVDNAADAWRAVAAGAATANGYGTYALSANGVWTYTLDSNNAAVQALHAGDVLTDTFTALTADGTAQIVTVTIGAQNVAPAIDLNGLGAGTGAALTFTEGGVPTPVVGINATINDDDTQLQSATIVLTNALAGDVLAVGNLQAFGITSSIDTGVPGRITVTLSGAASIANYEAALHQVTFSSAGDNPSTADRHIEVSVSDGALQSNTALATLAVINFNDAPVNTIPGAQHVDANHALTIAGLAVADPDAGAAAISTSLSVAHGILAVGALGGVGIAGSGTGMVTLTGSVAQINAALGAGNLVYTPAHDFSGADALTMTTNDHGNTGQVGPLSDTDVIAINVNAVNNGPIHVTGTAGADSFTALPGSERIDASTGVDTVTFGFRLTDATVKYQGNAIIIDGPGGSHTELTGVERFVFTDGTVDNNDGDPLVDDLFYYSHNQDVWNAHVDADAHFHQNGWREGRDPNAFFSTATYLSLNPGVKAAGLDPLVHFDLFGWKADHDPSIAFDVSAYLAANPDVKAAGIDPLAHFLSQGAQEGRQPIAPTVLLAPNGFDYVYYLQHNPDVAAAHADPFQHFETIGWKEGRNPNALFNTNGYLATYGDVKAAGINPLDHYDQFGWHEGRDPSGSFDTSEYLGHNADVAAAGIDPLVHFLANGIHEGRLPFADGHIR